MAKKLSRKQKKELKKQHLKIIQENKGYNSKQIRKLTYKELEEVSSRIVTENKKKEKHKKQYEKQKSDTLKKRGQLLNMGIDPAALTTTNVRKVKKKDIENGNVNKKNYPFLYPKLKPKREDLKKNFKKVYTFPKGHGLYIAYMDLTGENDFEELLARYDRMSDKDLLLKLNGLIHQEETYNKEEYKKSKGKRGTSSGAAGDYQLAIGSRNLINNFDETVMSEEYESIFFPKRKRQHTGQHNKWQKLTDKNGDICIRSFTLHKLLALTVCVMDNITEDIRASFYERMYLDITYYFKELKDVLPAPL